MKKIPYNFLGIPEVSFKEARFVILPIPFEATTSCLTGTREGPFAIIDASHYLELYDEELDAEPYLAGIKTLPQEPPDYKSLKQMAFRIKRTAARCIKDNKIIVGLGGEHTVSLGIVEAYHQKYPDIKVISFDAHADLRDSYQGTKYSHACVMRRIMEQGIEAYLVGVRSISKQEKEYLETTEKVKVMFACRMDSNWDVSFDSILTSGNYYISFDLDFFDPSILPETGTPEPGGFQWNETIRFLRRFIMRQDITVVGFDVVELSPSKNVTPSSFLAAKLIYKMMGMIASKNKFL